MRSRFVVLLVAVVLGAGGFVAVQSRSAAAHDRREAQKIAYGRSMDANQALLDSLPLVDAARFMNFTEIGGPVGGTGHQWIVWYSTDGRAPAEAAVARHAEQLRTWPEFVADSRHVAARDGDRWIIVAASEFGEQKQWGFSVTLNALDGPRYPAPR